MCWDGQANREEQLLVAEQGECQEHDGKMKSNGMKEFTGKQTSKVHGQNRGSQPAEAYKYGPVLSNAWCATWDGFRSPRPPSPFSSSPCLVC